MAIQILFLVMGFSGSYDDATQWVAAALPSLDEAEEFRKKALAASQEAISLWKTRPENRGCSYVYFEEPTKYDLNHSVRDGSVSYRVMPVPFMAEGVDSRGLFAAADAFASAQSLCREVNWPARFSQMYGRPEPAPLVEVKSDFADKLRGALATA